MFIRFAGLKRLGDTWQVVKFIVFGVLNRLFRGDHNSDIGLSMSFPDEERRWSFVSMIYLYPEEG